MNQNLKLMIKNLFLKDIIHLLHLLLSAGIIVQTEDRYTFVMHTAARHHAEAWRNLPLLVFLAFSFEVH